MSTVRRKRLRAVEVPPPPLTDLPTALLSCVVAAVQDPKTLIALALSCKTVLDIVLQLPEWHAAGLRGGHLFRGTPMPIARALAILVHRRCELCRRKNVGSFRGAVFSVFAHDACVERQLINAYHLTRNQLPRLQAACAQTAHRVYRDTRGFHYTAVMYWKQVCACMHPSQTVEGAEVLTLDQAAAEGVEYVHRQQLARLFTHGRTKFSEAREAWEEEKRKRVNQERVDKRLRSLDAELAAQGLPAVAQLPAKTKACISQYLSRTRLTAPYPLFEAVSRVRASLVAAT